MPTHIIVTVCTNQRQKEITKAFSILTKMRDEPTKGNTGFP